jgi:NAD(P)-dependent dehydrogenase (short-subunit alcohol dehydrogenase family)
MDYFLNKIAIVTGGGSGIGRSVCKYLARHGARVIIADRNLPWAQETESLITSSGGLGKAVYTDVTHPQDIESLIHNTVSEFGRIDFLFNNAGISVNGEFIDIKIESWKQIFDVNLWGVFYGCYYAYPIMIKQGSGHIINTASLAGLIPGGLTSSYSASKHAVVGFSLTLRSEAKYYGIKVSALCPGYIRTHIHETTPNVSEFMNSEKNKKMNTDMKFLTPDDCIHQIMRGVRRNKGIIVSPSRQKLYWYLYRLSPEFIPNFFIKIIRHMKKNAE